MPDSSKYLAIMDDLLLHTSEYGHLKSLKTFWKLALLKNGLKISPKKCQLFQTELQYMEKTIFIEDKSL